MLLFNIVFCLMAVFFAYRGIRLFLRARDAGFTKESVIAMAIVLLHGLILIRSVIMIEVGPQKIEAAGLLLNYYLYLGSVTIQMLISDFVINFVSDKITTKTTEM